MGSHGFPHHTASDGRAEERKEGRKKGRKRERKEGIDSEWHKQQKISFSF